jgi:hypothetical protein
MVLVYAYEYTWQCGDHYSGCWRGCIGNFGGVRILEVASCAKLGSYCCSGVDVGVGRAGKDDVCDSLCGVAGGLDHLALAVESPTSAGA